MIYGLILLACIAAVAFAWARLDADAPAPPSGRAPSRPASSFHAEAREPSGPPPLRGPRAAVRIYGEPFLFQFEYQDTSEGWRTYILQQPPYGARAQGGHESHRFFDTARRLHFICIHEDKQPVRTLPEAAEFARMWANGTVRYIDTGQAF
jgi:hypothetical protein